jgi:hypothetical protein
VLLTGRKPAAGLGDDRLERMDVVAVIPAYLALAGAGLAVWKGFRERHFSQFTLVIHHDTHNLNLGFLNGGTQPITVLQLSFAEVVLPEVAAQVPGISTARIMQPVYRPGPVPKSPIAPLVVRPKTANVEPAEMTYQHGARTTHPVSAAEGVQYLLELWVTVASGDGQKREAHIGLLRFSADGTRALWEPPLKPLEHAGGSYLFQLIEPAPLWSFRRRRQQDLPPGG